MGRVAVQKNFAAAVDDFYINCAAVVLIRKFTFSTLYNYFVFVDARFFGLEFKGEGSLRTALFVELRVLCSYFFAVFIQTNADVFTGETLCLEVCF